MYTCKPPQLSQGLMARLKTQVGALWQTNPFVTVIELHSLADCKGVVLDALDDIPELDFGGEGVAVVDDRLIVRAIPTVH